MIFQTDFNDILHFFIVLICNIFTIFFFFQQIYINRKHFFDLKIITWRNVFCVRFSKIIDFSEILDATFNAALDDFLALHFFIFVTSAFVVLTFFPLFFCWLFLLCYFLWCCNIAAELSVMNKSSSCVSDGKGHSCSNKEKKNIFWKMFRGVILNDLLKKNHIHKSFKSSFFSPL